MNALSSGCGSGSCQCAGKAQAPVASINGITLHEAGHALDEHSLRERAWGELLRQEAVRSGRLPRHDRLEAPDLAPGDRTAIESMLEVAVHVPVPTPDECQRYYDARKSHYVVGRLAHARHILFAVTDGIDVHKLAVRAEQALLELSRNGADPGTFARLARELSNCPSGAEDGDLGWIGPDDCADELANELFHQKEPLHGIGLRPRLVHSRYGLHIVEVLGVKQGRRMPYEEVRERIAVELTQRSRARALHQYMQLLVGQALVEGVSLEGASSPLVQ